MKKLLLIAGLASLVVIAGCTKGAGKDGADLLGFADCLTKAGAIFYGTERCPHCKDQKAMFGPEAMTKVRYIDCDADKAACQAAAITGYPTWKFTDGSAMPGTQQLSALAAKTNCVLPEMGTGTAQ
jgi:hypothetical protein